MRTTWRLVFTLGVLGLFGCPAPTDVDPKATITFPQQGGLATLPFAAGGPVVVRVDTNFAELKGGTHAQVELIGPAIPPDAGTTSLLTLAPQSAGSNVQTGETTLFWPAAGPFIVRAHIAGQVYDQDAQMDLPQLAIAEQPPQTYEAELQFPTCIESSAVSGTVDVTLTKATTSSGATAAALPLNTDGGCPTPLLDVPRRTHANLKVVTPYASFAITAALEGTPVVVTEYPSAPQPGQLQLQLTVTPSALPSPGDILQLDVYASLDGGGPAPNIPITIETAPQTTVLPPSVVTDDDGHAMASVVAPDGGLRIDVVSGDVRTGVTLERP